MRRLRPAGARDPQSHVEIRFPDQLCIFPSSAGWWGERSPSEAPPWTAFCVHWDLLEDTAAFGSEGPGSCSQACCQGADTNTPRPR